MSSPAVTAVVAASATSNARPGGLAIRAKAFLKQHYLPVGLASATLFGFFVPAPGIALSATPVNTFSIVGIFFISGLQLATSEVKKALRAYHAYLFGLLSILLLSPATSLAIARLPLEPRELALGQALFMAMPTTVSSGAVLTSEAKGNVALAILLSVFTNVIGVFTVPFFLSGFLTSRDAAGAFNPLELLWKLSLSILLPLGLGQALKLGLPAIDTWVQAHKTGLKYTSAGLLILVPWVVVSTSADQLAAVQPGSFAAIAAIGISFHAILLALNYGACLLLPIPLAERKSVVINASQKTINTAMSVLQFLPASEALGIDKGLLIIPCIISHFAQIIMDAYVASYWKAFSDLPAPGGSTGAVDGAAAGASAGASGAQASAQGSTSSLASTVSDVSVDVEMIPVKASTQAVDQAWDMHAGELSRGRGVGSARPPTDAPASAPAPATT